MITSNENLTELPRGWMWANLGDICYKVTDGTHKTPKYIDKGVPFISTSNIIPLRKGFDFSTYRKYISIEEHTELIKRCNTERGDILLSKCGTIGRTKLVDVDYDFSIFVGLALLKISKLMYGEYLEVLLNSEQCKRELEKASPGSTRKTLTINAIEKFIIPFPPLNEQHRIVAKIEELFTKLDAGVEALKKVRQELKRYRQAVLKLAFEGKLTEQWREKNKDKMEPASKLLERIAKEREKKVNGGAKKLPPLDKSKLPELPDGWEWTITSNVCSSVRDGTHDTPKYVEKGIPLVTSKNLKTYGLDFSTTRNISITDHKQISIRSGVERGDILFAMIGTVGNPVVVDTDMAFSIKNVGLFKKNSTVISSNYLNFWLGSWSFNHLVENLQLIKGTTQRFIPLGHLRILPVPMTSRLEQEAIVEEVERHLSIADQMGKTIEQGLKQSDRLRQSILKRAFEGKLVPQNPEDEPADKLLERIKAEKEKLKAEQKRKSRKELDNVKKGKRKDRRSEAM